MDPVGELVEAIQEAGKNAEKQGRHLEFVASVCGTNEDQQDIEMQIQMLKDQGVIVFTSNARAVQYCAQLLNEVNHARTGK